MQNHFFFGPTNRGGAKRSEERELPLPRRAAALGLPQRAAQEWTNCFHALDKKKFAEIARHYCTVLHYCRGDAFCTSPALDQMNDR